MQSKADNLERMGVVPDYQDEVRSAARRHALDTAVSATSRSNLVEVRYLGTGAYGVVTLVADRRNPQVAIAVKWADTYNREDVRKSFRREALLQRALRHHEHILKFIGMREVQAQFQLFIEYAEGGSLFDRIETDVGMPVAIAYSFFRQLLEGLEFIHSKGIVHRDLKPENLLLTSTDVLKIADFGLSTFFRLGDQERTLSLQCGTTPYTAPEVFTGKYRGEPIDIWSMGVVMVAMLSGMLPWSKPSHECELYSNWVRTNESTERPWTQMQSRELELLKPILCEDVAQRSTISEVKEVVRQLPLI